MHVLYFHNMEDSSNQIFDMLSLICYIIKFEYLNIPSMILISFICLRSICDLVKFSYVYVPSVILLSFHMFTFHL